MSNQQHAVKYEHAAFRQDSTDVLSRAYESDIRDDYENAILEFVEIVDFNELSESNA